MNEHSVSDARQFNSRAPPALLAQAPLNSPVGDLEREVIQRAIALAAIAEIKEMTGS